MLMRSFDDWAESAINTILMHTDKKYQGYQEYQKSSEKILTNYFAERVLESLDLSLDALFLWIKFVLTALSSFEKTAVKLVALGVLRITLTNFFKAIFLSLFCKVRFLSWRIFLRACLSNGMWGIVT